MQGKDTEYCTVLYTLCVLYVVQATIWLQQGWIDDTESSAYPLSVLVGSAP